MRNHLLFVFSRDDGSREGCSIFYATYLIVEFSKSEAAKKVRDEVQGILKKLDIWNDEGDWDRLLAEINGLGLDAQIVHSEDAACYAEDS